MPLVPEVPVGPLYRIPIEEDSARDTHVPTKIIVCGPVKNMSPKTIDGVVKLATAVKNEFPAEFKKRRKPVAKAPVQVKPSGHSCTWCGRTVIGGSDIHEDCADIHERVRLTKEQGYGKH